MPKRALAGRLLPLLLVALVTIGLDAAGGLRWLDNGLVELRMRAAPRAPTGSLAVVDIDERSLAAVGRWPWPRSVDAAIVDRLSALGASTIAFDVDFSAAGDDAGDAAFSGALVRAGGGVALPAFRQNATASGGTAFTQPLPAFAGNSWPAIVNVTPDADGRVRGLPYGENIDGQPVPSLAALLGGGSGTLGRDFLVDFSIDAGRIDHISAIDVVNGTVDSGRVAGKTIIVGASAIELRDFFYVPVHGLVSGAVLQTLGAESILQGRTLARTSDIAALLILLALLAAVAVLRARWIPMLAGLAVAALGVEFAAMIVQAEMPLALTTAPLQAGLSLLAAVTVVREINFRAILILISRNQTRNTQAILDQVVADNFAGVLVVDQDGVVLAASRAALALLGHHHPLLRRNAADVLPPALTGALFGAMHAVKTGIWRERGLQETEVARGGETRILEYVITPSRLSGGPGVEGTAEADRTVASLTFSDVTDRRAAEARIAHLARFDTLTGLPNRNQLVERLGRAAAGEASVIAIGLDRFGTVNETLGYVVGDRLLCAVAARISSMLEPTDLAARLDGDEFAVVVAGPGASARARALAQALSARVGEAYALGGPRLIAALSFGIACAGPRRDAGSLLKAAETALHRARASGGNAILTFDEAMVAGEAERQVMERELWEAFEHGEFEVYYQPQVNLADRTITGVEALLRWNHPEKGTASPGEFVSVAEAVGLIQPIGEWVLRQACADAARWPGQIRLAVNASAVQFARGDFAAAVANALAESGLPADRLDIEITESLFIEDRRGEAAAMVARIRALGVGIALDDFGTGYSSLGYLRKFPIDKLKLDRSFLEGVPGDDGAVAIVRAVAILAESLGIRLNAEGIEDPEQVVFLRLLGFSEGQGFLFGKPMQEAELRARLAAGNLRLPEAAATASKRMDGRAVA